MNRPAGRGLEHARIGEDWRRRMDGKVVIFSNLMVSQSTVHKPDKAAVNHPMSKDKSRTSSRTQRFRAQTATVCPPAVMSVAAQ